MIEDISDAKKPPSKIGPEKSILSSMLQDPVEYIPRAIEAGLTPQKFYQTSHGLLYEIFIETQEKGQILELITLTEDLMERDLLNRIGGPSAITEIYSYAPTAAHFDSHLNQVLDAAVLRQIIKSCTRTITTAQEGGDVKQIVQDFELSALTVGQESERNAAYDTSLKGGFMEVIQHLQSKAKPGMSTGISQIDDMTGGLHKKEITIIGARPSVGKTSMACTLCGNMSLGQGYRMAYFAMEGSKLSLVSKIMAGETGVSAKRIRDKVLNKSDLMHLDRLVKTKSDAPLFIDDRISTASEIAARTRRLHQIAPLDVVVIDYAQKLKPGSRSELEDLKKLVANGTNILHETCKSLNIALVLLAQLKRKPSDLDPQISDLSDSSSLEKDGDTIIFLARKEDEPEDPGAVRQLLGRVAKNRHGPTGDVDVNFNPNTTRFY